MSFCLEACQTLVSFNSWGGTEGVKEPNEALGLLRRWFLTMTLDKLIAHVFYFSTVIMSRIMYLHKVLLNSTEND